MARINTLPQSGVDLEALQPFNVGTLPILPLATVGGAAFTKFQNSNRVEGFFGNGDYVDLPTSGSANLLYFDNTDSLQFTITKANINAAVDDWVGFFFDAGVIYLVAVDEGTTPNTYYTASIDSAGSVTNIGNAQPASDFTTTAAGWWDDATGVNGSSIIQRERVNLGNIFVRQTQTTGFEEMEINISTGAIVSDPAAVGNSIISSHVPWKTRRGVYFGMMEPNPSLLGPKGELQYNIGTDNEQLINYPSNQKLTQWKNRVYTVRTDVAAETTTTLRVWNTNELNDFIDTLYERGGVPV